jgi:lysyl-tRNA synthetase class I
MDDQQRMALEAAKWVWPVRNNPTPSGEHATWADWYLWKFGKSLEQVRAEYRQSIREQR